MNFTRFSIPAKNPSSLIWRGNELVDWVQGGVVYQLDGHVEDSKVYWAYGFNSAKSTPDGRYAVVYRTNGTKAIVLRDGRFLREINRSFYCSEIYEYPVCIWRSSEGRILLAHCPDEYRKIEIEDADTGERLISGERNPADIFHSRLSVNPAGTRLLSAGWVWHPLDVVTFYEISTALSGRMQLDKTELHAPECFNVGTAEHSSACWQTSERAIIASSSEQEDKFDEDIAVLPQPRLRPKGVAVFDLNSQRWTQAVELEDIAGTMMPVSEEYIISFYRYPKLISLRNGRTLMRWEDIRTGEQTSSIIRDMIPPPLAIDVENRRFAVAGENSIEVIQAHLE